MKKIIVITYILFFSIKVSSQSPITPFERSSGKQSATYFEAIDFYKKLAATTSSLSLQSFNTTDAGYPLHLVLYSSDKSFSPRKWKEKGRLVILINNGIHAGEPDGIDASMILVRDIVSGKIKVPERIILAIIPVYNIGGALNRNSYSRVNQNGPESYGFRGNAQNLDLNRDFTKNDSKNARAFTQIFHYLNPDILIDNHVSDGADYQYTMTMLTTQTDKLGGRLGKFVHDTFDPALYKEMEQKKWPMTPYVNFEEGNVGDGWAAYYDPPRYSSGYAALFKTMAYVPETHMLKPFADRVKATYAFMQTMIMKADEFAKDIIQIRKEDIQEIQKQIQFPLLWRVDSSRHDEILFKGYEAATKLSEVTGVPRLFYDRTKPFEKKVKFFNYFLPENIVTAPVAYIIPQGWYNVIDLLKLNKIKMQRLLKDSTINVEALRIEDYKSYPKPYEKHHKNYEVSVSRQQQKLKFLKGDYIIYTSQPAKRYLIEMLEPTGDDSFFAWNFFDAILQQKEGYSDYRWEDIAAQYLKEHPEIKAQLEERKKTDKQLVSPAAQLNFVYKHSPYYEPAHMRYPVYRLLK